MAMANTMEEAEAARDELKAALGRAGITLPSLYVDPIAPLIELGRCNVATARQLAAAVAVVGAE